MHVYISKCINRISNICVKLNTEEANYIISLKSYALVMLWVSNKSISDTMCLCYWILIPDNGQRWRITWLQVGLTAETDFLYLYSKWSWPFDLKSNPKQASTLGNEVLYQVWVRLTQRNSWYRVETVFLFIVMVTLTGKTADWLKLRDYMAWRSIHLGKWFSILYIISDLDLLTWKATPRKHLGKETSPVWSQSSIDPRELIILSRNWFFI